MLTLPVKQIEKLIYPVSFYRTKAVHVTADCEQIMTRFGGEVPATMDELLTLPGVGRKTANLVLILAHRSASNICVDTHVHRISNRLGWIADPNARGNRARAVRRRPEEMVAADQPLPGHVGAERLPAGLSSVQPVRPGRPLSETRGR